MGMDHELRDFDNVARLFPLPGVVLFPHVVLPLHIFEPRYRQMTEHALASDRLVAIVKVRESVDEACFEPPLEEVACLGKIVNHERLPDGRFNFLLLGLRRVRLVHELPRSTLYRQAEVELLEDEPSDDEDARRESLTSLFRAMAECQGALDPDLDSLLRADAPLGVLTDIVAHALGLSPQLKQSLLAETRIEARADGLIAMLREFSTANLITPASHHRYPPPICLN